MKKSALLLIVLFSVNVFGQTNDEPLFRIWDKAGKEGFIDASGRVRVKPQFDRVSEFDDGLATVVINGKLGFLNRQGELVIKPQFDAVPLYPTATGSQFWEGYRTASRFSEGLAAVRINGKWGYINRQGEVVIQPRWDSARPFQEGLASVADKSDDVYRCGYINKQGKYVIAPGMLFNCSSYSDGLAHAEIYETYETTVRGGYLDKQGNWAIKPQFYKGGSFKDGVALVLPYPEGRYYLIDKTGRKVSDGDCPLPDQFSEGLAIVFLEKEKQLGAVNQRCETVFKLPPDIKVSIYGSYFSEGLAAVCKETAGERRCGYIDRTGKVVIPFQFKGAREFSDGLALIEKANSSVNKAHYINREGKIVIETIKPGNNDLFKNGLAFRFLDLHTIRQTRTDRNTYGYMNKQGKYVWLSPGAENYLDKEWIKNNYVGPEPLQ
jgi:hypothetical protein